MYKRFASTIPGRPPLKRGTYRIPEQYRAAYEKAGITSQDEQMMFFHLTQFGGFTLRYMPQDMEVSEEFLKKWFKSEKNCRTTHYKANRKFIEKFGNIKIQPLRKQWEQEYFNEDDMRKCGYTQQEIDDSFVFLRKLNDFYSTLRLSIIIPQSGISPKDRIYLSRFHGIPFLVKKPKAGGRFFHPGTSYQRIGSSLRELVTIDGKRTAELDLAAATLHFMDISLRRLELGSLEAILAHQDPYQYFLEALNSREFLERNSDDPIDRENLKKLVYTAIYSRANRQKSSVNRKLSLMGRRCNYAELVDLFPEFFAAVTSLKAKGLPHMMINREESRYAQKVLETACLEAKLPVLPIHDSFMTTERNIRQLGLIMDHVSQKMYGRRLPYKRKF